MPQKKSKKITKKAVETTESDSTYFLKLVLYVILGSVWLKFESPAVIGGFIFNGVPIGLLIGIIFARQDHFQVDRKIEYAILLVVTILSYFAPSGILI